MSRNPDHIERRPEPGPEESKRRSSRRRIPLRVLMVLAVIIALAVLAFRLPSAERDFVDAYSHLRWEQLPWLFAAIAAETASFVCYALVQRRLLIAGGALLTRRSMLSLAVAATGLTNLVPGGTAPASGWLVRQYRRRGIPMPVALWAVLAGGYAATVSVLTILLVGAGIARLIDIAEFVGCAVVLVGVAAAVVVAAHRMPALVGWLERRHAPGLRLVQRVARNTAGLTRFRTRLAGGLQVLGLSLANWVMDVFVLISAFGLLGLPIPWRSVVFAYATAQVAGSLAPLPGGVGFVEGGMIGAFALTHSGVGNAIAATVIYRAITCWGMAGVGSLTLLVVSRRRATPAVLEGEWAIEKGLPETGRGQAVGVPHESPPVARSSGPE